MGWVVMSEAKERVGVVTLVVVVVVGGGGGCGGGCGGVAQTEWTEPIDNSKGTRTTARGGQAT